MAENKKSFILYADQIALFENLDDDEAGRLIKHIYRYVNDLNPECPDKITKIAFEPIKHQLKRDLVSWEETCAKRSESGKLGWIKSGEARRNKAKQNEANEASASKTKQSQANEADNDTENDNDNGTDKVNTEPTVLADYSAVEKTTVGISYFIRTKSPTIPDPYVDLWNLFAEKYGCAKTQKISDSRKRKLRVRLNDKDFDFVAILGKAKNQEFALKSKWFTFDWLIANDTNYVKVLEEKYVEQGAAEKEAGVLKSVNYDN